jgi:hypothetical protein
MEVRVFADDESTARAGAKFGPKGFGSNEWLTPRMIRTVTPELPLLRLAFAILSAERMGTVMSEPRLVVSKELRTRSGGIDHGKCLD